MWMIRIVMLSALLVWSGCSARYVTPGRGAEMSAFGVPDPDLMTDQSVLARLSLRPLATFPAALAVTRVQEPMYRSYTSEGVGQGRYSVVTTRDVESDESFRRLGSLPRITGVAPVTRLLLPGELRSDMELRQAAAALHADLLLIYTLDTVFTTDDLATPLSVITLGLSPNQSARVSTTASAVLMDTRNGYVYAVAETTAKKTQAANAWTNEQAVEDARRKAEAEAFEKLLSELEQTWPAVLAQHDRSGT